MALSQSSAADLLRLLFNNTTWANVGDATGIVGSTGAGSFYVSLHTADPTAAGNQTSNEATYTSYARVAVARTTGGWTVSGTAPTQVANVALVSLPACTGGTNTITHVAIGRASSGTGEIISSQALSSSLAVSNGVTPQFAIGSLVVTAA